MGDWTAAKVLPKWTFRERTRLLYHGQEYRVSAVHEEGAFYDLELYPDGGHTVEYVGLAELLAELPNMAKYKVGDAVSYNRRPCTVGERKWSKTMQLIEYQVRQEGETALGVWAQEYQLQQPMPQSRSEEVQDTRMVL